MCSDKPAIRVCDVTKHYLMFERPEDRLKQMVQPRLARLFGRPSRQYYRDFAALNGISFDIGRGETVGIIGRNGCGKSTLLQIVCGTFSPSSGSVEVNGRIAALLELGAGFNPDFTGRENVYLNASILGLTKAETDARFDDIARFADIGIFIDQPVKTYSSGMYVRLAFAVAINVDPDILVVDEALAVGDEAFQRKCFARIENIREKGATILFVSHAAQAIVQLCDRAMLFDRGEMIMEGQPKAVVNQYQRFMHLTGDAAEKVREQIKTLDGWAEHTPDETEDSVEEEIPSEVPSPSPEDQSQLDPGLVSQSRLEYDQNGGQIRNVHITTLEGRPVNVLVSGDTYIYHYTIDFTAHVQAAEFAMMIKTTNGLELAGLALQAKQVAIDANPGESYSLSFPFVASFGAGTYFCNAGAYTTKDGFRQIHRVVDALPFRVVPGDPLSPSFGTVNVLPPDMHPSIERLTSENGNAA